jgi:UDP-N-acetylmuramate dehydrogenase
MNSAFNAPVQAKPLPNFSLKDRNTFGFDVTAEYAYDIHSAGQIPAVMRHVSERNLPWRVLGGGSNVILPKLLQGATLLMNISGQEILSADQDATVVAVGAGMNWHEFVAWTLEQQIPGLENLALIPGTVGASPIQNIGAYGVEVGEYIISIKAFDTQHNTFVTLGKDDCQFAYRDSLFKHDPHRFIVTEVIFSIPKTWKAKIHYADLARFFEGKLNPSAEEIFAAVCQIRTNKLPDPKAIGNAGSFFQNPVVSIEQYEKLLQTYPDLVSYPDVAGKRKLAAGWLIDQCGFKGKRHGEVGVYEKQALVLVNHGTGTAQDILNLAKLIQEKVFQEFGVNLEIEPNVL